MIYPEGMTEQQVQEIIMRIAVKVAPSFKFGCHTTADMIQQAAVFACEALACGKYDAKRPLENFLYTHVTNRLINFKRDKFRRTDSPCKLCYGKQEDYANHPDGKYCQKYLVWHRRNERKQNVLLPLDISCINDENESNARIPSSVVYEAIKSESIDIINAGLPIELRAVYLQMREGLKISKARRDEVERAVLDMLED